MPNYTLETLASPAVLSDPWYAENIRRAFGRPSFDTSDDRAYWFATVNGGSPALWVSNAATIVKTLQALFNVYTDGPALTVDGVYGPKTQARLEAYARSRGVPEATIRLWSGPGPMPLPLLRVALQLIVGKLASSPGWASWSRAITNTQSVPIVSMPPVASVDNVRIELPPDLDDSIPWMRRINNGGRDEIFAFYIGGFSRFPTFAELGSALADEKFRWSVREMNAGRAPTGSSLKVAMRYPRVGSPYMIGQALESAAPINAVVQTTVDQSAASQPPEVEQAGDTGSGLALLGAAALAGFGLWWVLSGDKR